MLFYDITDGATAFSTEIGEENSCEVLVPSRQAHGVQSAVVSSAGDLALTDGVDALVTTVPGLGIGVKTADCVPVLLFDPVARVAAAIHSGWKGTEANICAVVVGKLSDEFGSIPSDIMAVVGPCIHLEAFEVGDEVYERFRDRGLGDFCARMPKYGTTSDYKWHIDLPGICEYQLRGCGVDDVQISPICTYASYQRFYSARRLGLDLGQRRIITAICMK